MARPSEPDVSDLPDSYDSGSLETWGALSEETNSTRKAVDR